MDPFDVLSESYWGTTTIGRMLSSETYIGNLVQLKTKRSSFGVNKFVVKEKDSWIKTENTHEPIITEELFNKGENYVNNDCELLSKEKYYSGDNSNELRNAIIKNEKIKVEAFKKIVDVLLQGNRYTSIDGKNIFKMNILIDNGYYWPINQLGLDELANSEIDDDRKVKAIIKGLYQLKSLSFNKFHPNVIALLLKNNSKNKQSIFNIVWNYDKKM